MRIVTPGAGGFSPGGYSSRGSNRQPMSPRAKTAWKRVGMAAAAVFVMWLTGALWRMVAIAFAGTALAFVGFAAIPASAEFVGPALWGAVAGFTIGWGRRAHLVRGRLGESFISAFFSTKIWRGTSNYPLLELAARTVLGYAVGLAFSGLGLTGSGGADVGDVRGFVAGYLTGAGGGPGPDGGAYLALLIAAIVIGIIVFALLLPGIAWITLHRVGVDAIHGAIGGVAKSVASQFAEDWGRPVDHLGKWAIVRAAFRRGAARGAVNGALTGALILPFLR